MNFLTVFGQWQSNAVHAHTSGAWLRKQPKLSQIFWNHDWVRGYIVKSLRTVLRFLAHDALHRLWYRAEFTLTSIFIRCDMVKHGNNDHRDGTEIPSRCGELPCVIFNETQEGSSFFSLSRSLPQLSAQPMSLCTLYVHNLSSSRILVPQEPGSTRLKIFKALLYNVQCSC